MSELVARPQGPEPTAETQGSLPAGSELRRSQPGRAGRAERARGCGCPRHQWPEGSGSQVLSPVETGFWAAQGSAPRGRRKCTAQPALSAGPQRRLCPRPCGQGVPGGAARGSHCAPSQAPLRSAQARAVRMVTGELEVVQITPAALSRSPALRGLGLRQAAPPSSPPLPPAPLAWINSDPGDENEAAAPPEGSALGLFTASPLG